MLSLKEELHRYLCLCTNSERKLNFEKKTLVLDGWPSKDFLFHPLMQNFTPG